jgi:hypothetical protein
LCEVASSNVNEQRCKIGSKDDLESVISVCVATDPVNSQPVNANTKYYFALLT